MILDLKFGIYDFRCVLALIKKNVKRFGLALFSVVAILFKSFHQSTGKIRDNVEIKILSRKIYFRNPDQFCCVSL